MSQRLLSLSIDLDALDLYLGLHGLPPDTLDDAARAAIPGRAAGRFGELCDALGVKGTLFVVGRDVANGHGRDALLALHRAGNELASHSFAHDYALSRRSEADIDADLAAAEGALEALTGAVPMGFRAPGYTLSDTLERVLKNRGYLYDSSLLPSPPYYAAKAAVMGAMSLVGRRSASIFGHPKQLLRPRTAHLHGGLVELPVSVLPGARVPFIGTLVVSSPKPLTRLLARTLASDRHVVVELHGADLVDASDGVPAALLGVQRELAIPARIKIDRLTTTLRDLLSDREGVTLSAAARLFAESKAE